MKAFQQLSKIMISVIRIPETRTEFWRCVEHEERAGYLKRRKSTMIFYQHQLDEFRACSPSEGAVEIEKVCSQIRSMGFTYRRSQIGKIMNIGGRRYRCVFYIIHCIDAPPEPIANAFVSPGTRGYTYVRVFKL